MPMKCPLCDHPRVGDSDLRCPNCQSTMTLWRNFDEYSRRAHRAGLEALNRGASDRAAELMQRAVVFNPDSAEVLETYGKLLGQRGHYDMAITVLTRARSLSPKSNSILPALEEARRLQAAARAPADTVAAESRGDADTDFSGDAESPVDVAGDTESPGDADACGDAGSPADTGSPVDASASLDTQPLLSDETEPPPNTLGNPIPPEFPETAGRPDTMEVDPG